MEENKEMIEEMAKSCKNCIHNAVCDKKLNLRYYFDNHDCEHYQPKLPKDSIVLSKEECDAHKKWLKELAKSNEEFEKIGYAKGSKETAEKILDEVSKHYGGAWLIELYEKYGVKD